MGNYVSKAFFAQSLNIPSPTLTEKNLPDQSGRVAIVTGGYAGVGQELSRILYQNNATVYVAGRSPKKASKSISETKSLFPDSKGRIEFLQIDLADLTNIKKSAEGFMRKEERLDVLINNAGVMTPPAGSVGTQGHEMQMATNVLGHFLFTESLVPVLKSTAASSAPGSVRVAWAGSVGINVYSPQNGVQFDAEGSPILHKSQETNYGQSKAGNLYLAIEFARRYKKDGIMSVGFNPGNLSTDLPRHLNAVLRPLVKLLLGPAIFGAYTELYSGWSEEVTLEKTGSYVIPWGREGTWTLRADVKKEAKKTDGEGAVAKLWDWCVKETKAYV